MLLGSLKEKSPDTKVTILMTDDGKIVIIAIYIVYNNDYTITLSGR